MAAYASCSLLVECPKWLKLCMAHVHRAHTVHAAPSWTAPSNRGVVFTSKPQHPQRPPGSWREEGWGAVNIFFGFMWLVLFPVSF